MHFFVHASAPAFAPFAPHLESLIQPFTVWASPAKETEATIKTNAAASNNKRTFRMSPSLNFPTRPAIWNSTTRPSDHVSTATRQLPNDLCARQEISLSFFARPN